MDEILVQSPESREHPGLVRAEPVVYRRVAAVREEDGTPMPQALEEEYLGLLNSWGYFMVDGNGSPWDSPDPTAPMVVAVLWPGTEGLRRVAVIYGHPDDTFIRPGADRNWIPRPGWEILSPAVRGAAAIAPGQAGHIQEEYDLWRYLEAHDKASLHLPHDH